MSLRDKIKALLSNDDGLNQLGLGTPDPGDEIDAAPLEARQRRPHKYEQTHPEIAEAGIPVDEHGNQVGFRCRDPKNRRRIMPGGGGAEFEKDWNPWGAADE